MTSRLPNDTLQQLAPLLGSLARMVQRGSQLADGELTTLLVGAGLESDQVALDELRRWGQLLKQLRQTPTPELRHATVEALMLRGLSEATALLAVTTVAPATEPALTPPPGPPPSQARPGPGPRPPGPPPPKRLSATITELHFGMLRPGESPAREFEVSGGPGQVFIESDQLRVTPREFGADTTRVRVEVKPLDSGLLWTSMKLSSASETLEIPVTAEWGEIEQVERKIPTETILETEQQVKPSVAPPVTPAVVAPVTPPATPPAATPAQGDADLVDMIEAAFGVTPPGGKPKDEPGKGQDDDLLEQLNDLIGPDK